MRRRPVSAGRPLSGRGRMNRWVVTCGGVNRGCISGRSCTYAHRRASVDLRGLSREHRRRMVRHGLANGRSMECPRHVSRGRLSRRDHMRCRRNGLRCGRTSRRSDVDCGRVRRRNDVSCRRVRRRDDVSCGHVSRRNDPSRRGDLNGLCVSHGHCNP
jgi:hypothetical protein